MTKETAVVLGKESDMAMKRGKKKAFGKKKTFREKPERGGGGGGGGGGVLVS